jgi:hypothetical protein
MTFSRTIVAIGLLCSSACTLSLPEPHSAVVKAAPPPDPKTCEKYNDRHFWAGTIAAGASLGAGGSGFASLKTDDKNGRLALGITAIVLGVLGAASGFGSQKSASDWANAGCGK